MRKRRASWPPEPAGIPSTSSCRKKVLVECLVVLPGSHHCSLTPPLPIFSFHYFYQRSPNPPNPQCLLCPQSSILARLSTMLASTAFPPPEFQAPPPSPEGVERLDQAGEDDALEEFFSRGDNAAAVPELVLPDRLLPRQIHSADPPEVDFRSLGVPSSIEDLRSAARTIGCIQIVNHAPEFYAPPPSPEGVEKSDQAGEDDALEEFFSRRDNAAVVPELVLPDPLFPRQIHSADPPEVDFRSLGAPSSIEDLRSAARTIGCFQIVNHGIPREVISAAEQAAAAVFLLPSEKIAWMATSAAAGRCGFEGDGEGRDEELFWWSHGGEGRFDASEEEMAGIWPGGYRDFSCKMGRLQREVGKIAGKLGQVLFSEAKLQTLQLTPKSVKRTAEAAMESTLHISKHRQGRQGCPIFEGSSPYALQHDAVRLLIRSCEHPHALCIHVTRCSGFQVFSKRGWVSFHPNNEALVVTIGNQIQAWRGSLYRHVAGKPVFPAKDEASISIAVLYSCTTMEKVCTNVGDDEKTNISLAQQAILALSLTLLYHIIVYLCGNM